jgi:hypothetical protein
MSSDEDEDPFSSFLDPGLRSNPKQFVSTYFQLAKVSNDPQHALYKRHNVSIVGINKSTGSPQHKSLTVSVDDGDTGKIHLFIIERNASIRSIKDDDMFESFTASPNSKSVLESIHQALQDMSTAASNIASTSLQAFALGRPSPLSESTIPLLPLTNDHASPSNSTPPSLSYLSRSLSAAVAATRSSSRSSPAVKLEAEDTILGVRKQDLGRSIRQYDPQGLCLFHLVVLAHVVHKLAPTYALFESQCYWYANVIFEVILLLFPSKSRTSPPPGSSPTVRLPDEYLPKEAGRWFGVLINDPRVVSAVVTIAKTQFESQLAKYRQKVTFCYCELINTH